MQCPYCDHENHVIYPREVNVSYSDKVPVYILVFETNID